MSILHFQSTIAVGGFESFDFTLVARSGTLGLGTYVGFALNGNAGGQSITPTQLNGEDIFVLATLAGGSPRAGNLQLEVRNIQVQDFFHSLEFEFSPIAGIEFFSADADFVPGTLSSWYWETDPLTNITTPLVIKV